MRKAIVTPDGLTYIDMPAEEELAFEASRQSVPALQDFSVAVQKLIDETAAARNYTNGVSLASYAASTVPAWAAEATTFIAWRDAVWSYAYAQLALVQAGTRAQPAVAVLVSELPSIVWP